MSTPSTKIASDAMLGYGTKLEIESVAGTGVFFELLGIKTVPKPSSTTSQVDVTNMNSPLQTEEQIAGMINAGEMALPMNWSPGNTTDDFIEDWKEGGNERRTAKITTPNGKIYSFLCFILDYTGSLPATEAAECELTLKVAGGVSRLN